MTESIQYISQTNNGLSHLENIQHALESGVSWVQLRMKKESEEEKMTIALAVRDLCDVHHATMIINDHVELALKVGADGVHLGKEDMSPAEARKILGSSKIIGATANTLEDIRKAVDSGADYVGLGPFRFTTTKEKLSPVLGLEGYTSILQSIKDEGLNVPIVAIGGIEVADISALMKTGIAGIAVSGLLSSKPAQKEIVQEIKNIILSQKEGTLC